jgi:alpha-tubulin suppressor-like RCC1 family protein
MGTGNTLNYYSPRLVVLPAGYTVVDVACGLYHTVLLTNSGNVLIAGANNNAQMGDGTTSTPKTLFTRIEALGTGSNSNANKIVAAISAGTYHTCILAVVCTVI